ncbi:MAG: FAD-dependent oxidoreductase, partial [Rhodothermales bacterium]
MNVVIIGAGPVGLYLGCLLRQLDIACTILEQRLVRSRHSRSIGIHPPALRRLEALGVVSELVEQGITVRSGVGLLRGRKAGTLSFESLVKPFNFVLAVPQHITEARLETHFLSLGGILERGHEVVGMRQDGEGIVVTSSKSGHISDRTVDRVVACDGRRSTVRDLLEIPLLGSSYADHYVMGDFPDTTAFGDRAAIYLDRRGVVECFPLPDGVRRWVARIDQPVATASTEIDTLVRIVSDRTSIALPADQCSMHSSFTAERCEAERFFVGGIALA